MHTSEASQSGRQAGSQSVVQAASARASNGKFNVQCSHRYVQGAIGVEKYLIMVLFLIKKKIH